MLHLVGLAAAATSLCQIVGTGCSVTSSTILRYLLHSSLLRETFSEFGGGGGDHFNALVRRPSQLQPTLFFMPARRLLRTYLVFDAFDGG